MKHKEREKKKKRKAFPSNSSLFYVIVADNQDQPANDGWLWLPLTLSGPKRLGDNLTSRLLYDFFPRGDLQKACSIYLEITPVYSGDQ
ncbi:hypothetical protein TNCT_592111 [Trichonephila clavata]|uniref:Uncharacterized protein n=1 Tax=Trichonephila clavata TaxID=2740835 RepID=A0A8X6LPZ2_TRICU|nr:hypothetical protein TNCT_592111 [Trichonephila clavata]